MNVGFFTTLVLQAAENSLAEGVQSGPGVTRGQTVDLARLASEEIGVAAAKGYGL